LDDLRGVDARLPVKRGMLGTLMMDAGALAPERLEEALSAQRDTTARLGDILVGRGWASRSAVASAAARQFGSRRVDLRAEPPDPSLLDPALLDAMLAHRFAPWRREAGRTVFVAADYEAAARALAEAGLGVETIEIVLAAPDEIAAATVAAWGADLAQRAASRTPAAFSVRGGGLLGRAAPALVVLAVAVALWLAPETALGVLFVSFVALNALNAVFRVAVLREALAPRREGPPKPAAPGGPIPLAPRLPDPRVTLLIPLYDEPEVLPLLLEAVEALDWPRELLDVKLVLEADDRRTALALAALSPAPFIQVLTVPPGGPRTKPRALNHALEFAEGEIVGVYDAEDRPEADQLRRVAAIFRAAGRDIACVQCRLAYYNPRDNWLTRCFAIEYAIWFDVLLSGFRRLGLPIPLGGTSVFFRVDDLRRVGAWDAHNVTEDADLGMRLARRGLGVAVCGSTTHEEAASRPGQWLRQRSRWLKGYMSTWAVHMRNPLRLHRDLGWRGFLAFQAIFLGAAAAYLGLPVVLTVWAMAMAGVGPDWLTGASPGMMAALLALNLAGWAAMAVAALAATARRRQFWLWPWVPTLFLYWPMGAVAAWLAVVELVAAPTLWRKTPHGFGRETGRLLAAALRRRSARADPGRRAAG
jgi:cellulose synthase/poly-beta-1,6-N-acetylglucosamine synthase-like glycosyltransferase